MEFEGSFVGLAIHLGSDVVGEPLTTIRYNAVKNPDGTYGGGGDTAIQYTTKGMMIAVKVDDNLTYLPPYFFPQAS